MNELEFMELLSELPAEYVEAAAAPQPRRKIFRKVYGIPAVAACVAVIIAAVIYPQLRVVKPDQVQKPDQTAVVTTVTAYEETTAAVISGTEPTVTETVQTGEGAAPEQTATAAQSAVTEQTVQDGTQEDDPAQPAASADHAGKTSARTTAKTTVHTTAKAITKATTKATTPAPGRTTAATRRTTAATRRTTAATRTTTAPSTRMTSANTTRRTTAPVAQTTKAPPHTTRAPQTTWAPRTTRAPQYTTEAPPDTSRPAAVHTTRDSQGATPPATDKTPTTTEPNGQDPPVSSGQPIREDQLPVIYCILPADESEHYYGETLISVNSAEDMPVPEELSDSPLWETLELSQYDCMCIDYYVRCGDAAPQSAWRNADNGLTVRLSILGENESFCRVSMLVFIPHGMYFDADASRVGVSYQWNSDMFYNSLPDDPDYIPYD